MIAKPWEHLVAYDRLLGLHLAALDWRGAGDAWSYPDGRTTAGRHPVPLTPKERVMIRALVVWAMDNATAMGALVDGAQLEHVLEEYSTILAKLGCRR